MQYRAYGNTGAMVSILGLGTLRSPKDGGRTDHEFWVELLKAGLDLGINYIDTAAMTVYGSEGVVGRVVKNRRDQVFISTKNHYRGESGDEWQAYLDRSLVRLDTDYIDFYHLHALRWEAYRKIAGRRGPWERLVRAKNEGMIRHICFSSHDRPENIKRLMETGEFAGMLVQYNVLDRSNEEVMAEAHARGMGVAIMGPLGGGRLVENSAKLRGLWNDAANPVETALRFVLANPHVSVALSGMITLDMLKENVRIAERAEPLSAQDIHKTADFLGALERLADLYCTGCRYCMPCPQGVDIPGNFKAVNQLKVWGLKDLAGERYLQLKRNKKRGDASRCTGCGRCEPLCPQRIPIREQLRTATELFETTEKNKDRH